MLRSYKQNRFVRPSGIDPISFAEEEIKLMKIGRTHGFDVLELSPLAPLGSFSYGFTDQNKIISALRGTEVLADATNLMALEAALRVRIKSARRQLTFARPIVMFVHTPSMINGLQHISRFFVQSHRPVMSAISGLNPI